jgi:Uma2 family endonuclease
MNLADVGVKKRLLTVDAYHRMGEVGIFAPDERVELIEGEIVERAPIGSKHSGMVTLLNQLLVRSVGERALISVQNPVRLSNISEPEPDFAVLKTRADYYQSAIPRPEDVLLVVEVAEASLAYDRKVKLPLYAVRGIPEVWIIDVVNRMFSMYSEPTSGTYAKAETTDRPGVVRLAALPDVTVDLTRLF